MTRGYRKHQVGSSSARTWLSSCLPLLTVISDVLYAKGQRSGTKGAARVSSRVTRGMPIMRTHSSGVKESQAPPRLLCSDVLTQRIDGGTPPSSKHYPLTIHKEFITNRQIPPPPYSFNVFYSKMPRSGSCGQFMLRHFILEVFLVGIQSEPQSSFSQVKSLCNNNKT